MVFTNGCFDILTAAHVSLLRFARQQGDKLVVGLNSDLSIRSLKGPNRPLNPQAEREAVLYSIRWVDEVIVFHEPDVCELLRMVQPQVWVKGGDYDYTSLNPQEVEVAEAMGCGIKFAPKLDGVSTSAVLTTVRRPLAVSLYNARRALARILVAYRHHLQGNWYEDSAKDAGLELDGIGHLKGPYAHDDLTGPFNSRALEEVDRLAKF